MEDRLCVWHVLYMSVCVCAPMWRNVTALHICVFARLVVCHSALEQPLFTYTELSRGGTMCVSVLVWQQRQSSLWVSVVNP